MDSTKETSYERKSIVTSFINTLPDKTKRWIFLTSLLALVQDKKDMDENDLELIKHLNDVFKITAQPRACLFSMKIKNFIWKDIPKTIQLDNEEVNITDLAKRDLSKKEIETVGEFIKSIIPSWLKYDNDESVMNDVQLLMEQMKPAI